jgi:hypothetical protein
MDRDTSHRTCTQGIRLAIKLCSSSRTYPHAPQICLLIHPSGNSIAARTHYAVQLLEAVESGEMQALVNHI